MNHRYTEHVLPRAISLCLAAVVTLALLGGIDHLSQPADKAAHWAQAGQTRA